ncbi:unnamed protein product [Paramecium primaurelia]|uniref:Uncharacterized protein n=1 Tax=Paramecium primaurelia TaxID=5886 RepID=A0A8S1N3W6_PARPR|nr:unnamed protein product [Paramecium primaurelia]
MNYRTIKQLTIMPRFYYQQEILKPSKKFTLKPKPYCETLHFQRERNKSRLEWLFGTIFALFYFMNIHGKEFIYFPWFQPSKPEQL